MKRSDEAQQCVIPSGQANSNAIDTSCMEALTIYAPGTLTNAITIQTSPDGTAWFNQQDAGADLAITVNEAVSITRVSFPFMRIHSAGNEGGARTFRVTGLGGMA